jgi:hypothetical protein
MRCLPLESPAAQFRHGAFCYSCGMHAQAAYYFQQAAKGGDADARRYLTNLAQSDSYYNSYYKEFDQDAELNNRAVVVAAAAAGAGGTAFHAPVSAATAASAGANAGPAVAAPAAAAAATPSDQTPAASPTARPS